MLLAAFALVLSLLLGAPVSTPAPAPTVPALPPTQPGLSHNEGWFLVTSADDGSQAIYFIAGNARHSITQSDAQLELQVNPLWPIRQATQDEVVAIPEGAPVGGAKPGLLGAPAPDPVEPAAPQPDAEPAADSAPAPDAAPAADAAPASYAAPVTYVLERGDNLTRIAAQYGTTVDAILAANGISNPNRIYAGLPLIIPIAGSDSAVADDTAAPADVQGETSTADSADAADTTDEAQTASTYTVAPGDSAFKIARRFGIDEGALLEANNISNPNRVYVGQVLTIPGA